MARTPSLFPRPRWIAAGLIAATLILSIRSAFGPTSDAAAGPPPIPAASRAGTIVLSVPLLASLPGLISFDLRFGPNSRALGLSIGLR